MFGNYCRDYLPFMVHPVATIAKSRQFLDGLCTVVQEEFSAGIILPFVGSAFVFSYHVITSVQAYSWKILPNTYNSCWKSADPCGKIAASCSRDNYIIKLHFLLFFSYDRFVLH